MRARVMVLTTATSIGSSDGKKRRTWATLIMDVRVPKGKLSLKGSRSKDAGKVLRGRKRLWIGDEDVNDDMQSEVLRRPMKLQRQVSARRSMMMESWAYYEIHGITACVCIA